MTILSAFEVVLAGRCGGETVTIGTPTAGRVHVDTEPLIGVFINTLILRTSLAGDPSFREVVKRVRETTLGAFGHAEIPASQLMNAVHPRRGMMPPYSIMCQVRNVPKAENASDLLEMEELSIQDAAAGFDLALEIMERADGLCFEALYDGGRFESRTIDRLLDDLKHVLSTGIANPDWRLSEILRAVGPAYAPAAAEVGNATTFLDLFRAGGADARCAGRGTWGAGDELSRA